MAVGDLSLLAAAGYALALAAFTFDNIPGEDRKVALFAGLRDALRPGGQDRRGPASARTLQLQRVRQPLGRPDEMFAWVNETTAAPRTIYVLGAHD